VIRYSKSGSSRGRRKCDARRRYQELLEVQAHFGLPSTALVEKDWYVVKALAAIAAVDTAPFQLVFGGGTALTRAHRLIRRMSEDIDLKIVSDGPLPRSALRRLRDSLSDALLHAGFRFDPDNPAHRDSGNASRYTIYRLPYKPITGGEGALRPEIQIETAVWPLRRRAVARPVISFVAEGFTRPAEVTSISCVSIVETAAEKFVALTRRVGAELAGAGGPRDPTLVRHLYDLHVIRAHYDASEVLALARTIMMADADAYGHQFLAYRANPIAATLQAVNGLATDPGYAHRYAAFVRNMVYGDDIEYGACVDTVRALTEQLGTG
jgi:predicted nucleotidyltransferase component of viral defense system